MGHLETLSKRITSLEAAQPLGSVLSCCDWRRKLAKCYAALEGRPWACTGNLEQKRQREAKLARHKAYFDGPEAQR